MNDTQPNDQTDAPVDESVRAEREKAEGYLANWQRAEADFQNYKRRMEQERIERSRYAEESLLKELLPVLDDLDRAIANVSGDVDAGWIKGVELTRRNLLTTLERHGVKEIPAAGLVFNPNVHEAVMDGPGPEGTVLDVFQTGFTMHDRVLRPAQVRVGSGE